MRTTRTSLGILAAVALAAAARPAAAQSFTIEGFGGWQNLRLSTESFTNAVHGDEGTAIVGGDVLAGLGPLGVGVLLDKTVSGSAQPWAGAILGGFLIPLSVVRIEALGELGRRGIDFGDMFDSNGQTFVGFRPGVSLRLGTTSIILGVSGIARWNTSNGDFGKPDYGLVGRVGLGVF